MKFSKKPVLAALTLCMILVACLFAAIPALAQRGISVTTAKPIDSERRVALVIGNGDYKSNPLRNPVNDARAMSRVLTSLGFEVIKGEDLDKTEIEKAIIDFAQKLRGSGVGLFYYAGHGVQVNGRNYLIPIGARIPSQAFVRVAAVDLDWVNAAITDARNRLNIIVLDACRDNPLPKGVRSGGKGLAVTPAPKGTLIAYATAPGSTAADGIGRNGLYTSQLLKYMQTSGLPVERVFKRVRQGVDRASGGRQIPWEHSSIVGDFYFKPIQLAGGPGTTPGVKPTPPPPAPPKAPGTDDLAALKEEARRKAAWDTWQKRMDAYWKELEVLDGSSLSAKKKARAWRGALNKFKDDNRFSDEDESLRERARKRFAHWNAQAKTKRESPPEMVPKRLWVTNRVTLTVRNKPGLQRRILGIVHTGQWVKPLSSEKEGWVKVRTVGGHEGWMLSRYLMDRKPAQALIDQNRTPKPPKGVKWITDSLAITLRSGKGVENKVVGILNSGDRVEPVSEAEDGWIKVRTHKNLQGWTLQRYLVQEKPAKVRLQNSPHGINFGRQTHSPKTNDSKDERSAEDSQDTITDSRSLTRHHSMMVLNGHLKITLLNIKGNPKKAYINFKLQNNREGDAVLAAGSTVALRAKNKIYNFTVTSVGSSTVAFTIAPKNQR